MGLISWFGRKFNSAGALGYLNWMPDELYLKIVFRGRMNRRLNLRNPSSFNEKLQWLKLYDRKSEYTLMVDKNEAKKYVAERIGDKYIIPTLGVWEKFDDIDFDSLPNQFVLKCTNDSGGLVICRDKTLLDIDSTSKRINRSLNSNYFWSTREWPYRDVKPRVIAEKYMADEHQPELIDYKFFCFCGKPEYLYISRGLDVHATAEMSFLTPDWKLAPFGRSDYKPFISLPHKPSCFEEMLQIASRLSKGHSFIRVDLYEICGRVYFSELTFSPAGGFVPFEPRIWDEKLGELIVVEKSLQKNDEYS